MSVRVRFAPSPTGHLHVGNVRTALFNWLFARRHGGTFVLRIEDTDAVRSELQFESQLMLDLRWLGLNWDEGLGSGGGCGPYRQSQRFEIYREKARLLLDHDSAYYCFCSPDELERVRELQLANDQPVRYSAKCRALDPDETRRRVAAGEQAVVRLKVRAGTVSFDDLVFGPIVVDTSAIGDFVLLRSDGSAQYNFACVIDDSLMGVSHVIRGEGHLSNTSRQLLVYEALGLVLPRFAHLSTILGPDGAKLSKRHGATSIQDFRAEGYLPDALVNYLALLGWTPPEEVGEILTSEELIRYFDLGQINRNPATFDLEKLNWINRAHLKSIPPHRLEELALPYLIASGVVPEHPVAEVRAWVSKLLDLTVPYVSRLSTIGNEALRNLSFTPEVDFEDPEVQEILSQDTARRVVKEVAEQLAQLEACPLDEEGYRSLVARVKASTGARGRELFRPIRVALTARASGPELDKLLPLLEEGRLLGLPVEISSVQRRAETVAHLMEDRFPDKGV